MNMRLAKIDSLAIDSVSGDMVVILSLVESGELLPIWIGNSETVSIAINLKGFTPPRPLSHDLTVSVLDGFGLSLERVIITALVDNTYFALLYLTDGEEMVILDARPSDSIALAVRTGAPVFVSEDIPVVGGDPEDEDRMKLEKRLRRIEPEQVFKRIGE